MAKGNPVATYLRTLDHPRKAEVEQLVALIADARAGLECSIKWNAPNFAHDGQDRITLRIGPGETLQIIFHRGAKAQDDGFAFIDPTGLLVMKGRDRGLLDLMGRSVEEHSEAILCLANAWLDAAV